MNLGYATRIKIFLFTFGLFAFPYPVYPTLWSLRDQINAWSVWLLLFSGSEILVNEYVSVLPFCFRLFWVCCYVCTVKVVVRIWKKKGTSCTPGKFCLAFAFVSVLEITTYSYYPWSLRKTGGWRPVYQTHALQLCDWLHASVSVIEAGGTRS